MTAAELLASLEGFDPLMIPYYYARNLTKVEAALRPPPNHVICDDGMVRKVLGEMVLTADDCIIMHGPIELWCDDLCGIVEQSNPWVVSGKDDGGWGVPTRECRSTREAAKGTACQPSPSSPPQPSSSPAPVGGKSTGR